MAMLEEKQKELKEVSDKLETLRVHFQEKNSMKLHLESQVRENHDKFLRLENLNLVDFNLGDSNLGGFDIKPS